MYSYLIEKLKHNRNSLALFAGNGAITLLNFFILSLLSYLLPIEWFGTYRQLLTMISIVVALGSLGLANSVYYFLSSSDNASEKYKHINTSRILIISGACISVFVSLLFRGAFAREFANPLFNELFSWGILVAFILIIQTIDLNMMLDAGLLKWFLFNSIGCLILRIIAFIFLSEMNMPLVYYLWAMIATALLQSFLHFIQLEKKYKKISFSFQSIPFKDHLVYALPLGVALFFGVVMNNIDRLVLSHYIKDVKAFAILANGNFEVPVITNLYIAFSTIALPVMVRAYKENNIDKIFEARFNYIRQIVPVLFPIVVALIFWSVPIITLLFGQQYSESGAIFAIYSLSLFIRFSNQNDLFLITGKTKYIIQIQIVECILNLILNIILIPKYGIIGASIAFSITNFIYFVVNTIISARLIGRSVFSVFPWRFLIFCIALSILLILPFSYFELNNTGNYSWIFYCILYLVACGLLFYLLRHRIKNKEHR